MAVTTTSSAAWARRGRRWGTRLETDANDASSSLAATGASIGHEQTNALRLGLEPC